MVPPTSVSVGVVLRAANQKSLIASGNHTFIHRQSAARHVPNTTSMVEWNHLPTCHSEGANASRGIFPSCRFYLVVVLSPTWWIPPLRFATVGMTYQGAVPFTHTGYFCHVSGTAHRPFPTVSLVGGFVQPHGLYTERCLAMNHRRYIAWYHSTIQIVYGTWRAADLYRVVT